MKVYVITKAKPFQAEQYMGVKSSKKSAEKDLRDAFPYMRKSGFGDNYVSDKENTWLLFIHEEELG